MKIVTTPNPVLLKIAEPVTKFDSKLHEIIRNMEKTLLAATDPKGVGLAAPQVGLSIRLFLTKPNDKSKINVFINPVIQGIERGDTPLSGGAGPRQDEQKSRKRLLEGCLSVPTIWGYVKRAKDITLSWQDENGQSHTKKFQGFVSTIIQHEIDHLNGMLFTKHVISQNEKLYKSFKNEEGEDEFEEIKI